MQRPGQPHRRCSGFIPEQLRKSRVSDKTSRCCWDGTRRQRVSYMPKLGRLLKHPGYRLQPGQTNDGGGRGQAAALLKLYTTRPLNKSLPLEGPKRKNSTTQLKTSFQPPKDKDQLDPENQWTKVYRKKKTSIKTINETTPKDIHQATQ